MKNTWRYIILMCTLSAIGLIIFSSGGKFMEVAGWVSISVALLGVAGSIWAQIIQFKKDAQRIDAVNKTSASVKHDTTVIRPLSKSTDKNVQKLLNMFLKRKVNIDKAIDKIDELVGAKRADELTRQRLTSTVSDPTYIQNAIKLVYEKNAELEIENARLNTEIIRLSAEVQRLADEKESLNKKTEVIPKKASDLVNRYDEREI